jgi:CubicO group peptidase (beta-lactamase class C family)
MRRTALPIAGLLVALFALALARTSAQSRAASPVYFPERFGWEHRTPAQVGMNPSLVDEAVQLAVANESAGSKVMQQYLVESYGREPFDTPIGPYKDRGPASGVLLRCGYIVAEWGEPKRVDMTFSVTKTFLTTTIGLAWQRGLIRDVTDAVRDYMPAGVELFEA